MPPLRTFTVSQICDISRRIHRYIETHREHFAEEEERIDLEEGARQISEWLDWNASLLRDFHEHGQKFGCPAGGNVFRFALEDAKRYRMQRGSRPRLENGRLRGPDANS